MHTLYFLYICIYSIYSLEAAPLMKGEAEPAPGLNSLWYRSTSDVWLGGSLLLGNGNLGASLYGSVVSEMINLNEHSVWSGGPFDDPGYTGNNDFANSTKKHIDFVRWSREYLNANLTMSETQARGLEGGFDGYGSYEPLGALRLDILKSLNIIHDFRRELDMDIAVAKSTFTLEDGTRVHRETFCSYPDDVCVLKFKTSADTDLGLKVVLEDQVGKNDNRSTVVCRGDTITLRSYASESKSAMLYEVQISVLTMTDYQCINGSIVVPNPRDVTIILAAGSNFDQTKGNAQYNYSFCGLDPHNGVVYRRQSALYKSYSTLYNSHVTDYKKLYDNFYLNWGVEENDVPTDTRMELYNTYGNDTTLEWLVYNFGRYCLISASRVGTLPANLQGIWADKKPNWSADYHTDINLQMNYWMAGVTGLTDTVPPVLEYIVENWMSRGQETAKIHYNSGGFVAHEELNIFGSTGPRCCGNYAIYPLGLTWMASTVWDYFDYTQDIKMLQKYVYPIIKGSAEFWLDYLTEDKVTNDGTLIHYPCQSPEHGDITFGCTHSQLLIWENFQNILKCYELAGDTDINFIKRIKSTLSRLDPGLRIGRWGQLQEWKRDVDDPNETHRHLSHLLGVWPGYMVSSVYTDFLPAAEISLVARGNGLTGSNTGWEKVWRAGMWASFGVPSKAHDELKFTIQANLMDNLMSQFTDIYQIDANYGYTAGATAMFFRDPDTVVDDRDYAYFKLLPAVPTQYQNGTIRGVRGRGGFSMSYSWNNGKLYGEISITAERSRTARDVHIESESLRYKNMQVKCAGNNVPSKKHQDRLIFNMKPGVTCAIQIM